MKRMARKSRSYSIRDKAKTTKKLWSSEMDRCLARVLAEEVKKGNKVDNVFKTAAYTAAQKAVNNEFGPGVTKNHVMNRMRTWKKQYATIRNLRAQKGFIWDEEKRMIIGDTGLWNRYIKKHPFAKQFWGRSIQNYDEFCTIFGDQAAVDCSDNDAGTDTCFEDNQDAQDNDILLDAQSNDNPTSKLKWSGAMDYYLGKVLVEQVREGHKKDNVFHSGAYDTALVFLKEKFGPHLTKDHIKNRLRTWKKKYIILKDILSRGGFKWDPSRKMVTATNALWNSYIKTYPDARLLRDVVVENYETWHFIFAYDYGVAEDACLPDQAKNILWTDEMDDCLSKVLVEQVNLGNKSELDNKFKPEAFVAAVSALNERFQLDLTRDHVKDRLKTWKKQYEILKQLLAHCNFQWDETEKMVKATDSAWKAFIRKNLGAQQLQGQVIKNYDDLPIIFGNDDLPESSLNSTDDNIDLNADNQSEENTFCVRNDAAKDRGENLMWTQELDRCLSEQLIEQVVLGNKLEKSFKLEAFESALAVLNNKFSLDLRVEDIRKKLRIWRKEYKMMKDLLSEDRFQWDERRKIVIADDSSWKKYIERNPAMSRLRSRPIKNYPELCIIVGDDQSSGSDSETGNETAGIIHINGENGATPVRLVFDEEISHGNADADANNAEPTRFLCQTGNGARNPLQNNRQLHTAAHNEDMRHAVIDNSTDDLSFQQPGTTRLALSSRSKLLGKRKRSSDNTMLQLMSTIASNTGKIVNALEKRSDESCLHQAIELVQAIPGLDDDLIIDACEFLSLDEKRAIMFVKLNARLRKKWLLKRLRC